MARVLLTEPAEYDLIDTEYHINVHLLNPTAADRIVDGIVNVIDDLCDYPKEHPMVNDQLLARLGVRMTWFDNYNIFYYYDEPNDIVHILRILYNRVDWQNELKR